MDIRLRDAFINLANVNVEIFETLNEIEDDEDRLTTLYQRSCLNTLSLAVIVDQLFPDLSEKYKIDISKLLAFDDDELDRAIDLQEEATARINDSFEQS